MGHKVHPKSVRLGYIRDWESKWFSLKEMPDFIEEDRRLRVYLKNQLKLASVSKIVIERPGKYIRVNIYTSRPGIVIGKGGQGIENLRKEVESMTSKKSFINVMEIKKPELDAQLAAEGIAFQLEKQIAFRRAMKKTIEKAMASGAGGIKVMVSGRLGGAEIARTEWLKEGRVPLQTFRADIDYGFAESYTTMGQIGVKVWIFKKELFKKTTKDLIEEAKLVEASSDSIEQGKLPKQEVSK
ncbi:MAG: 30S ribosomal protein S3 [Endomicrobium sp.]|jgi:small subunit ribosomal protein S3|uniref:30S ribosomal protein S3 n=1 Tax=Candidatus Endomicrobiellum cubanum TaxID=3242325 RepID=UPI00281EDCE8|nr:30S ribosomal protein S3 [Endomicrobium sp.]MDR2395376.1 30S ribosomal protein S3 [Endomicrobium sp.]